jgi:hypothetical protein
LARPGPGEVKAAPTSKAPSNGFVPGISRALLLQEAEFPMLKARLHCHDGRYSVLFDGKLLVDRSRDPECDAARALLAQGINSVTVKPAFPAPSSRSRGQRSLHEGRTAPLRALREPSRSSVQPRKRWGWLSGTRGGSLGLCRKVEKKVQKRGEYKTVERVRQRQCGTRGRS